MVKHRNLFLIYLLMIVTFGIYSIVWTVKTKNEFNSLGAKVPTAWLLIVPIVNLYWIYKYSEAYAVNVKKDNNTVLWFILGLFVGIIMPLLVQMELNKIASGEGASGPATQEITAPINPASTQPAQQQVQKKTPQQPQAQQQ